MNKLSKVIVACSNKDCNTLLCNKEVIYLRDATDGWIVAYKASEWFVSSSIHSLELVGTPRMDAVQFTEEDFKKLVSSPTKPLDVPTAEDDDL